jgi:hypothetical protein
VTLEMGSSANVLRFVPSSWNGCEPAGTQAMHAISESSSYRISCLPSSSIHHYGRFQSNNHHHPLTRLGRLLHHTFPQQLHLLHPRLDPLLLPLLLIQPLAAALVASLLLLAAAAAIRRMMMLAPPPLLVLTRSR